MKIEHKGENLYIYRDGEPKIYSESLLYYKVKQALNEMGEDLIKKEPYKDGHMTRAPYYLRDRKGKYAYFDRPFCFDYFVRNYNNDGFCSLTKVHLGDF